MSFIILTDPKAVFDLREYLAEGDREQAWNTASAEAHGVHHFSYSSPNSFGTQNSQIL